MIIRRERRSVRLPASSNSALAARADVDATRSGAPTWFESGLLVGATAILAFGGLGLLFAVFGRYRMLPVFVLALLLTALLCRLAWRAVGQGGNRRGAKPAIAMVVVSAVLAFWNAAHVGEHVAVDIDSGGYAVTGRWIATHGSLSVPAGSGWPNDGAGLGLGSPGMFVEPGGHLQFQFVHFLPALMAEAFNVGGDRAMFALVAVLGSLALGAIYAVGCRLIDRPWLVLVAVSTLGISLPQVWLSRDPYSETSTQFLLWSGIWLLSIAYERRNSGASFVSGLLLAGTLMARIDAAVFLLPLPLLAAGSWLAARRAERAVLAKLSAVFVAGCAGPAVLGTFDLIERSKGYYAALGHRFRDVAAVLGVLTVVAALLIIGWNRMAPVVSAWHRQRSRIAVGTAIVVGATLLLGWTLRPSLEIQRHAPPNPNIAILQRAEGLPVDPARTYGEQTLRWMGWYLGPVAMTLAILGLALLTFRSVKRPSPAAALTLTIAGACSVLYLWAPTITPSQIYVMRRFVPATLPLLVLSAAYAADSIASVAASRSVPRGWTRAALAAFSAGLIVPVAGAVWPARDVRVQAGYGRVIASICHSIGTNAAVLIARDGTTSDLLPQTVRSWCAVPVAVLKASTSAATIRRIGSYEQAAGKALWLFADTRRHIDAVFSGGQDVLLGTAVNDRQLEWTLSKRPAGYFSQSLTVYGTRITR